MLDFASYMYKVAGNVLLNYRLDTILCMYYIIMQLSFMKK